MPTQVVKFKKGIPYLYEQVCVRDENGKPTIRKTRYIGPCAIHGFPKNATHRKSRRSGKWPPPDPSDDSQSS